MATIKCPECGFSIDSKQGKKGFSVACAGGIAGAFLGSGIGIVGGPIGGIAGTIPGAIVGSVTAYLGKSKFIKCSSCGKISML